MSLSVYTLNIFGDQKHLLPGSIPVSSSPQTSYYTNWAIPIHNTFVHGHNIHFIHWRVFEPPPHKKNKYIFIYLFVGWVVYRVFYNKMLYIMKLPDVFSSSSQCCQDSQKWITSGAFRLPNLYIVQRTDITRTEKSCRRSTTLHCQHSYQTFGQFPSSPTEVSNLQ